MNQIQNLLSELETYGTIKNYNPNDIFIKEGSVPRKIGIVKTGLFRYCYSTLEGKEFTKGFMAEGNVISSYSAMISETPSYYNIEALEHSNVVEISFEKWNNLRKDYKWDKLLIALLEKGFKIKEKREREFLLLDAENRYKNFLAEFPNLEKRLKQHMIASYLGITPIALSRIRRKLIL